MLALLSVFSTLEGFTSDLYPYRYVVTPIMALIGAVLVVFAVKRNFHRLLWRHRLATALIGTPLLIVSLVVGDYLFSPLWERSFLNEASPIEAAVSVPVASTASPAVETTAPASGVSSVPAVPGAPSVPAAPTALAGPRIISRGTFRGADDFHFGRGDAQIIRTETGAHILRFENFSVRNGPDLYVYLSRDETGRRVEEPLNLGRLRATDGAFNYELPANIDLTSIKSVVVWCRQFTTLFAHAPLIVN